MNLIQEMGIKDLEHVVLKAKNDMVLGNRIFEAGEPVLYFSNIQIALLSQDGRIVAAKGGYGNQPKVIWEEPGELTFQFSNGTLNPISLNLLLKTNMLVEDKIYVPHQQIHTIDNNGKIFLPYEPAQDKPRFYYSFIAENLQEKIKPVSEKGKIITFDKSLVDTDVVADYYFQPKNNSIIYTMGRERKPQLYTLEATFYLKDENEGLLHTGVLEMPKVYIMSNINLRMGERADPTVGTFRIVAMPDKLDNSNEVVCRVSYIDDDIYGI